MPMLVRHPVNRAIIRTPAVLDHNSLQPLSRDFSV